MLLNKINLNIVATALPVLNTYISTFIDTWTNLVFKVNGIILNKKVIKIFLNKFWTQVMLPLDNNQHVLFIFKVKFIDNQVKTLCTKQVINKTSKKDLIDLIVERLGHSTESYSSVPINEIIFLYKINNGEDRKSVV